MEERAFKIAKSLSELRIDIENHETKPHNVSVPMKCTMMFTKLGTLK